MADDAELVEQAPSPDEYAALREALGWGVIGPETARTTTQGALYSVCLRQAGKLVGLGRVIGDGALYFYITDIAVAPGLAGGGHGHRLMAAIMRYIEAHAADGATVAILSAAGVEPFYARYGFSACPNAYFGQGMAFLAPIERLVKNGMKERS